MTDADRQEAFHDNLCGDNDVDHLPVDRSDAGQLRAASATCRNLAASTWPAGAAPTVHVKGRPAVDVSPLVALDRGLLRWLGIQFTYAARRVAGRGTHGADVHAVNAARSMLDRGGARPAAQAPIAWITSAWEIPEEIPSEPYVHRDGDPPF